MPTINPTLPEDGDDITQASNNTPLEAIIALLNGNLDAENLANLGVTGAKIANLTVTAGKLANNASLVPIVGGAVTAGQIVLQVTTATITVTAGTTNNQYGVWPTAFTTLLAAWATVKTTTAQNKAYVTGADGSTAAQGHAQAYNPGASTETLTCTVFGIGIL